MTVAHDARAMLPSGQQIEWAALCQGTLVGRSGVDALQEPGESDLTAHVDFAALADAARLGGAAAFGPVSQREFLLGLGILERSAMLMRQATLEQALEIESGTARLTDEAPTGMGALFKVLALSQRNLPPPPGFVPKNT